MQPIINVKNLGAIGDGLADDTAALQAALDLLQLKNAGAIYLPMGCYRITSGLSQRGNPSYGVRIFGDLGGTRGFKGSCILWDGPVGGTMLHWQGLNGSTIENCELHGNGKARHCLHAEYLAEPYTGSSGLLLRRLSVGNTSGEGSAAVAFGDPTPGNHQASEVTISDCVFMAVSASMTSGFRTLTAANTKNFILRNNTFKQMLYAVDWMASNGTMLIDGLLANDTGAAVIRKGAGCLSVRGLASETAGAPYMLLDADYGGTNFSSNTIESSYYRGVVLASQPHYTAIKSQGFLRLTGCDLRVDFGAKPVRVQVNPNPPGGCVSQGNFYAGCEGFAPLYDSAGNWIPLPTGQYAGLKTMVLAFGDWGGMPGSGNAKVLAKYSG